MFWAILGSTFLKTDNSANLELQEIAAQEVTGKFNFLI